MIRDMKNVRPCAWCQRARRILWFLFCAVLVAAIVGELIALLPAPKS
jgi:hypothetical protein